MLVPGLVGAADALSAAAASLVPTMVDDQGRLLGGSTRRLNFEEYDRCLKAKAAAFRARP